MGFGLLDLGYVAFFAIGAYTAAYFAPATVGIHLSLPERSRSGRDATALAGMLIGVQTLRLRGDYIAIVTLAFGEIVGQVVGQRPTDRAVRRHAHPGPIGIGPIDRIDLPLIGRFGALDLRPWYWFALGLVELALIVSVRLRDSRIAGMGGDARRRAGRRRRRDPDRPHEADGLRHGRRLGGISGAFFASYLRSSSPAG